MGRMFQTIPDLLGGVSQEPDQKIKYNKVKRADNWLLSRTDGVRKRPPTEHVGIIDPDISAVPDRPFIHTVKRGDNDYYTISIMNGEILVYDSLTGDQKMVLTPHGMGYLTSVTGFQAATIGDTTVILNKDVTVAKEEGRYPPKVYEVLLYVKSAQYSNTYTVDLGGGNKVEYQTAPLGDANADKTLATEEVAIGLYGALKVDRYFSMYYSVAFYGSSLHIVRNDGTDFAIKATDSLAGNGLLVIKGEVQKFEDLPPRAKENMVVKVSGDPLSDKDDYWVKYMELDHLNEQTGGVWKEIPAPGASTGVAANTMPWSLKRYGSMIGTRTVLKDPLAPTIRDAGWHHPAGPLNADQSRGMVLTDHNQTTNTNAAPDVGFLFNTMVLCYFDMDTMDMDPGDTALMELWYDYGGGAMVADSIEIFAGERLQNVMLRTPLLDASYMTMGLTAYLKLGVSSTGGKKPRVYVHPGTHPIHAGFDFVYDPSIAVGYPSDVVYPENHVESLRLSLLTPNIQESGYFAEVDVTIGPGPLTSSTLRTIMTSAINASGMTEVVANEEGTEVRIYFVAEPSLSPWFGSNPDGARNFLGSWLHVSREFALTTEVCYVDGDGFADDSLIGYTLINRTDGSYGVVSDNTNNLIVVASLTGGVLNTFSPGDVVEIEGAEEEYFIFDRIDWAHRLAGSDDSCPLPSFVGKRLSEVFFYRNRLGLCSGETINLSASGDLFRFMRRTATDLLDDDPIDITSSHQNIAEFGAAVTWKEKLFLFSSAGHQFILTGEPNLTPKTAGLQHIGSHPCSLGTRPITVGDRLFFVRKTNGYSRVLEMYLDQDNMAQTADRSKEIPQYIIGTVIDMTGDENVGSLFVLTDQTPRNVLYVYNYEQEPSQQEGLSAWHKWTFNYTSGETTFTLPKILTMDMVDGYLYMAIVRKGHPVYGYEGVMLERINLTDPTTPAVLHWDRYNLTNIASDYVALMQLPVLYPREDGGIGRNITQGQLKLAYVEVDYHKVGFIKLGLTNTLVGTSSKEVFYSPVEGTMGQLRLPVMGTNTRCTITIECAHFRGCGFTSLTWEGDFHNSRG